MPWMPCSHVGTCRVECAACAVFFPKVKLLLFKYFDDVYLVIKVQLNQISLLYNISSARSSNKMVRPPTDIILIIKKLG